MISSPNWLYPPFIANILILVPVCWSLILGGSSGAVFQGRVDESEGLRLLVGSLYVAILLASIFGLLFPAFFAPIILIQIVYKSLWLLIFVLPLITRGEPIPTGIASTFAIIVLTYPFFFWMATRST